MKKLRVKLLAFANADDGVYTRGKKRFLNVLNKDQVEFVDEHPDLMIFLTGGSERAAISLVRYRNKDVYYARGILGQYIFVIPSDNMVVVRLGHQRSKVKVGQHPNDIFVYLDAAFALLKN